jgi:hypothetical protein
MIRVNSRRHPSAALLLRRFSTGNNQTRPHAVLDKHRVVRSPQRDAGSDYRDPPTGFIALSIDSKTGISTDCGRRNPHSV